MASGDGNKEVRATKVLSILCSACVIRYTNEKCSMLREKSEL